MTMKTVYRFLRDGGGTTVTVKKPECNFSVLYRLIADEGKAISNGKICVPAVDTGVPSDWSEIESSDDENF